MSLCGHDLQLSLFPNSVVGVSPDSLLAFKFEYTAVLRKIDTTGG